MTVQSSLGTKGEWRLESEIGHGAYGKVYLAVGTSGERVAVKVCRRADIGDERYERELRGARLYRSIPLEDGLVRMRELVETEWGFYTVMDLADDEFGVLQGSECGYRPKTLARVIDGEKALPFKECVKLALALANGLAVLQRHHLLHRDIKPGNVLYVKGRPVLSDPGLLVAESDAASLVGTPGYVPPEKFADAASDIYSLGLTLKAASFGRQVEDLDKGPAMEADAGAALFPAWWRILNKATDPTPFRRHQSAKALVKDLKTLHMKMALASVVGSRVAKVAAVLFALAAVVGMASAVVTSRRLQKELTRQSAEMEPLRKFKSDAERKFKREERASQWKWMRDSVLDPGQGFYGFLELRIKNVAMTNHVRAAELRSNLDRIAELYNKNKGLVKKIDALYETARRKGVENADDEFLKAKQIDAERIRNDREIRLIRKGFGM